MPQNIRTRLTGAFICLAIIPILVVGIVLSYKSFTALKKEAVSLQKSEAARVSIAVEDYIRGLEHVLMLTSQAHKFMSLDTKEQKEILKELLAYESRFEELTLVGHDGNELIRCNRTYVVRENSLIDRSTDSSFQKAMILNTNYFSPVHFSPKTGEPHMDIAIPLQSFLSGKIRYILIGSVRLKKIWDLLANISHTDETVFIVDENGNIVGHPDPSVALGGQQYNLPDNFTGTAYGLSGEKVIMAAERLDFGEHSLSIIAQKSVSKALSLARNILFISLLVVVVSLLAAILLSSLIIGNITRPLQHLTSVARKIQQGDLEQQASYDRNDEVGELAHSFNEMTLRLKLSIKNLEHEINERQLEIEERKKAEEELRRLRNLLGNIINSMPSVIVSVDPAGNVTQWNQMAEKATGVSAADAFGQSLKELYPRLAEEMEKVHEAIKKRQPFEEKKIVSFVDGQKHFEDVTVYPLIANGIEGAVIRIDDVTSQTRIEEMMVQTEKMMSVGGLAAGMAHEINNPLGIMMQSSQNILRRISPDLPANIRAAESCGVKLDDVLLYLKHRDIFQFVEDIRDAGQRAASIVANMLQFSRKSESLRQEYSLSELIDKTIELAANDYDLKKKYDFRHIEIIREYAPDLPDVPVIVTELEQVILNLLKNGAQAMAESFSQHAQDGLSETKPKFIIRTKQETNWAIIEIEDNGPGMTLEVKKRIFEPFFTTKAVGTGTGLGLSVSFMIITNNHKGIMEVESEPGQGARFILRLPIKAN